MKKIALLLTIAALTGCGAETWIPIQVTPRTAVSPEHVMFLDEAPTKPYEVVGIITPESGQYETEAAAVRGMRSIAAKHGADAIFFEEKNEAIGWSFRGTTKEGSSRESARGGIAFSDTQIRAKAIVWK